MLQCKNLDSSHVLADVCREYKTMSMGLNNCPKGDGKTRIWKHSQTCYGRPEASSIKPGTAPENVVLH
eukprot:5695432-Amphidinium_carterae.2